MTVSTPCSLILLFLSLSYADRVHLPSLANLSRYTVHHQTDLSFKRLAAQNELEVEEHDVVTKDEYLLRVFRVRKKGCIVRGAPVVLNHGLLMDAFSWIVAGSASPAVLIASICVDLWLPNARGTRSSRRHLSVSPTDRAFWHFSVDEIGRYDLPAVIDHVLNHTGHTHLNYIGFSQGGGTFFIMCSELPHYCEKVGVMIALAPATRHTYTKSVLFRLVSDVFQNLRTFFVTARIHEVFSIGSPVQKFLHVFCPISNETLRLCEAFKDYLSSIVSFRSGSVTAEALKVFSATFFAGTSAQNMARYGQSLHTEHFQKFDYGSARNMQLYGSAIPPVYNFSAVTAPVVVIYCDNDGIVDVKDVEWCVAQLPNVLEVSKVNDSQWNHLDMTYGKNFKDLVFPKIYEYLSKYSNV